jgi:hypothetical protein
MYVNMKCSGMCGHVGLQIVISFSEKLVTSIFMVEDYIHTMKMDTAVFSETLVTIYRTTWRYIPEDSNIQLFSLDPASIKFNRNP